MRVSVFAVALCAVLALEGYSQSLGDLAKKEKERREAIGQVRVITGEQAPIHRPGRVEPRRSPPAEKRPGAV